LIPCAPGLEVRFTFGIQSNVFYNRFEPGSQKGDRRDSMLRSIQQRDLDRNRWIKITMAVILGLIIVSMVITLIPGLMSGTVGGSGPDTVASVGGQTITVVDFQEEFNRATRSQAIPEMMRGLYANQILDQMVFQRALQYEADRL